MNNNVWLIALGWAFVVSLDARGASIGGSALEAMRSRQEAVKSVEVEFHVTEIVSKGAVSYMGSGLVPGSGTVPKTDTTLESTAWLRIDGVKVSLDNNQPVIDQRRNATVENRMLSVTNGLHSKRLFPKGIGMSGSPEGTIAASARNDDVKMYYFNPLTMTFRGFDPTIASYPLTELKASGATLPIRGVPCAEYSRHINKVMTLRCWLDPKQAFTIRRMSIEANGRIESQTDIDYRPNETCGWVPHSWRDNLYSKAGQLLRTCNVEVRKMRVNPSFAPGDFELEFPEGTFVYDNRTKNYYRIGGDRTMHQVSPTGEDLGVSVAQPDDSWLNRHFWLVVAIGTLVAGICAYWIIAKYRAQRSAS